MKLIKLNKTHKLYREGYTWAWRFTGMSMARAKLENWLTKTYGYSGSLQDHWASCYGSKERVRVFDPPSGITFKRMHYIYWIGVRDPALVSFIELQLDHIVGVDETVDIEW